VVSFAGKGGKNRRRGKNENENEKRELVFKEDGQGKCNLILILFVRVCV
jgi:translation initiation factor 1A